MKYPKNKYISTAASILFLGLLIFGFNVKADPVDCSSFPEDPSCAVDCSVYPNDPACVVTVDCSDSANSGNPACIDVCPNQEGIQPAPTVCDEVSCDDDPTQDKCDVCPDIEGVQTDPSECPIPCDPTTEDCAIPYCADSLANNYGLPNCVADELPPGYYCDGRSGDPYCTYDPVEYCPPTTESECMEDDPPGGCVLGSDCVDCTLTPNDPSCTTNTICNWSTGGSVTCVPGGQSHPATFSGTYTYDPETSDCEPPTPIPQSTIDAVTLAICTDLVPPDNGCTGPECDVSCITDPTQAKCQPVNGYCGISNGGVFTSAESINNKCGYTSATTTLITTDTNAMTFSWACLGINGGVGEMCGAALVECGVGEILCDGVCAASCPQDGECGTSGEIASSSEIDPCVFSSSTPNIIQNGNDFSWTCYGADGGTDESCNATLESCDLTTHVMCSGVCTLGTVCPVNGQCVEGGTFSSVGQINAANACISGAFSGATLGGNTFSWTCDGSLGGVDDFCSAGRYINVLSMNPKMKVTPRKDQITGAYTCEVDLGSAINNLSSSTLCVLSNQDGVVKNNFTPSGGNTTFTQANVKKDTIYTLTCHDEPVTPSTVTQQSTGSCRLSFDYHEIN